MNDASGASVSSAAAAKRAAQLEAQRRRRRHGEVRAAVEKTDPLAYREKKKKNCG